MKEFERIVRELLKLGYEPCDYDCHWQAVERLCFYHKVDIEKFIKWIREKDLLNCHSFG